MSSMTSPVLRFRIQLLKYLLVTLVFVQWMVNFLQTYLLIITIFYWKSGHGDIYGQQRSQLSELTKSEEAVLDRDALLGYFTIFYAIVLTTWTVTGLVTLLSLCVEWRLPVMTLAILQSVIVVVKLIFYFWPDTNLRLTLIMFDLLLASLLYYYVYLINYKRSSREFSVESDECCTV